MLILIRRQMTINHVHKNTHDQAVEQHKMAERLFVKYSQVTEFVNYNIQST
jgi:predicted XRE-type DNA-binding protein